MIELNLLKYFDKSFSEIYQIEHGEIEEQPKKKKKGVRINILTLSILVAILLILIAVFLTLNVFNKKKTKPKIKNNIKKESTASNIKKKKNISRNNGKKYIKIGEIQVIETNDEIKPTEKTIEKQSKAKETKPLPPKKEKIIKKYNIKIRKLPHYKYKKLLKLAKNKKWKISKLKTYKEKKVIWRIYKIVPSSKLYIAGKPVKYLKYNYKKEDAIKFVKKEKIKAVIKKDYIFFIYYDLLIKNVKKEDITNIKNVIGKNSKIIILKN